jgi:hypothetical protein
MTECKPVLVPDREGWIRKCESDWPWGGTIDDVRLRLLLHHTTQIQLVHAPEQRPKIISFRNIKRLSQRLECPVVQRIVPHERHPIEVNPAPDDAFRLLRVGVPGTPA